MQTAVAKRNIRRAASELQDRISGAFEALLKAFAKGPSALAEINKLSDQLDELEREHIKIAGGPYMVNRWS